MPAAARPRPSAGLSHLRLLSFPLRQRGQNRLVVNVRYAQPGYALEFVVARQPDPVLHPGVPSKRVLRVLHVALGAKSNSVAQSPAGSVIATAHDVGALDAKRRAA